MKLSETVRRFFTDDDWKYTFEEKETLNVVECYVNVKNGSLRLYCQIRQEPPQIIVYTIAAIKVQEEKRHEIMEYLTLANYGIQIGNFELDLNDGEIRYKTSMRAVDPITTASVKTLVYTNLTTHDEYLPGYMAVIYGGMAPKIAIDMVETKT